MSKHNTNFDNIEKSAKLPIGPTFAIPGPTLPSVVRTALNVVSKSKLSSDTNMTDTIKINVNRTQNIGTDFLTADPDDSD